MVPIGDAHVRYNVRYYLFALLFVVFDVEAVFLYPWAVAYRQLGVYAFVEAMIFIAILRRRLRLRVAQARHGVDLVPHPATVTLSGRARRRAHPRRRARRRARGRRTPASCSSRRTRSTRCACIRDDDDARRQVPGPALQRRHDHADRRRLSLLVARAEPHLRGEGAGRPRAARGAVDHAALDRRVAAGARGLRPDGRARSPATRR